MVRYLITAGASLGLKSDDGMTALHLAAQNGHLESCHIILGANTRPKNHINVKDDGGWTPLVWACEHKHEAVIRYLLEQGADPFATDVEMNIALHWAAFSGEQINHFVHYLKYFQSISIYMVGFNSVQT